MAYVEGLAGEQQATAIGFISRAVAWFNGQGVVCRQVMSDNGPAYVSRSFAKACKALGLKHIRTRPYTPRTNRTAEHFIQTLSREWAYGMPFQNSEERNRWLPRYLSIYNRLRKHTALVCDQLSSGSTSCSADQPAETQHLEHPGPSQLSH